MAATSFGGPTLWVSRLRLVSCVGQSLMWRTRFSCKGAFLSRRYSGTFCTTARAASSMYHVPFVIQVAKPTAKARTVCVCVCVCVTVSRASSLSVCVSRASSLKRRCRPYKGTLTPPEGGGHSYGPVGSARQGGRDTPASR